MKAINALMAFVMALLIVGMPVALAREGAGRDALVIKEIGPRGSISKAGSNLGDVSEERERPQGLTREETAAKALEDMGIVLQEQYFKFSAYVVPIVQKLKDCGVPKKELSLFTQQLENAKDTLGAAQQQVIWAWMNYKWQKYGESLQSLKEAKKNWKLFKIQLITLANFKKQLEAQYNCQ